MRKWYCVCREMKNRGGRGEGTAKGLYTIAFEKEIVIGLQTGNQRVTREGNRGTRREGKQEACTDAKEVARGGGRRPPAEEQWKEAAA